MGLRLVLGRAGSGKAEFCRQEIGAELKKDPAGFPLLYIVPAQATFQAEYALFAASGLGGSMRAQVFSFRRLAWKVLQEVGGSKHLFIDDLGKGMVLRKVLEKNRPGLKVLKHAGEQGGVLENLVELSNELKRAGVTVSQLRETFLNRLAAGEKLPVLFRDKMNDLLLLLAAAAEELGDQYLDAEDYLDLLAEQAAHSSFLKGAAIWLDGFHQFTNQEHGVLAALLRVSRAVTVTLCLDGEHPPGEQPDELDPFYPVAQAYRKLLQTAAACRLPVEKIILKKRKHSRFHGRPELAHLEQNLFHYPVKPYAGKTADFLGLAAAPNRRCEVESLARELIWRARDEGCRWRDFAVICSSLDDYRDLIATIFGDYDIPFFIDRQRSVLHHPLVEFVRSALEIVNRNWRYSAVFRCFKTGFLFPPGQGKAGRQKWRERTDQLENYVLACGIQGGAWRQVEPWRFSMRDTLDSGAEEAGADEEKILSAEAAYLQLIQATRQKLSGPLLRFEEEFKAAATVKGKTTALYGLLAENDAWERLELWSREALDSGNPERAREHLQVYKGLIALFDQLVEIMGEEKCGTALYARLVETGLESLRLSLVPPSLDQVFVGDLERSRPGPVRYGHLLGANDGLLPAPPREDGIFSDEEREIAGGWGLELAPGARRRLLDEQFLIYMSLTRAVDGLRVSYPLGDEEGRTLMPSLLVMHLKELFPSLAEELLSMEPPGGGADAGSREAGVGGGEAGTMVDAAGGKTGLVDDEEDSAGVVAVDAGGESDVAAIDGGDDVETAAAAAAEDYETAVSEETGAAGQGAVALLAYVAHPRRALSHLAVQLSRWKRGEALHPFWWDLYNWYTAKKTWRAETEKLLGGVFYHNVEQPLRAETSRQLYGPHLRASVSRLELFRACPFAHFVAYGLRLRERPVYRLEAPDIGRFFHAVLRNFTLSLQEKGLNWGELERDECLQLVAAEVEHLVPRLQQEILLSSGRYRYLAGKLRETVGETVLILGEQDRHSSFKPVGVELFFGKGGTIPGMNLELDDGSRVELIGRIDRLDLARDREGRAYLRVIDYKAGRTGFSLAEVYHGLALQLFVYLDVVLFHAPQWLKVEALPGGLLYFRVHAPLIRVPHPLSPEEIEIENRKRYKMKGMILADTEVARLMDSSLQTGYSAFIPVALTKKGGFYKNSSIFTADRYSLLQSYLRRLIGATAEAIIGGEVAILPYSLGKNKACTYCPYRAICQFDLSLAENEYRLLREEKAEAIWSGLEKIQGEAGREQDKDGK